MPCLKRENAKQSFCYWICRLLFDFTMCVYSSCNSQHKFSFQIAQMYLNWILLKRMFFILKCGIIKIEEVLMTIIKKLVLGLLQVASMYLCSVLVLFIMFKITNYSCENIWILSISVTIGAEFLLLLNFLYKKLQQRIRSKKTK